MKVVLRSDVAGLGHRGEIVEVADGFAMNHLLPKGLAMRATAGMSGQADKMKTARDRRDARDRQAAEEIARVLVPQVIRIGARAGRGGKLYGSVTTSEVAEAVQEQTGIEIDRRRLHLDDPIREVGEHQVRARLHEDVQFSIQVEVTTG